MLTKNYKRAINGGFTKTTIIQNCVSVLGVTREVNTGNWAIQRTTYKPLFTFNDVKNSSSEYSTLLFGIGTTAPTEDDYNLESIVDESQFTYLSGEMAFDSINGKVTFTKTATYNGSSPIQITEIGFFNYQLMFVREVLSTPITVNNGDTFTVTMVIG